MENDVQAFKVLKNLMHGDRGKPKSSLKTGLFAAHERQREIHKLIPKQMLLHTERPLGISLRILPCNSSIQACIKSVGNHAKKSYLA